LLQHKLKLKINRLDIYNNSIKRHTGVSCTGHPRSGTHYITALISTNFLNDTDYLKIYKNHELPNIVQDKNVAYIHIWRDFDGTARSVFALKERFGLKTDSYENFLNRSYSAMWEPEDNDNVLTNARSLSKIGQFYGLSTFFKNISMTPREFWKYYNELWFEKARNSPNIISVKYNDMLDDFIGTMSYLANWLGSDTTDFIPIEAKVGWWK
jgi:hypothetical protein